jgi:hypothetical protein
MHYTQSLDLFQSRRKECRLTRRRALCRPTTFNLGGQRNAINKDKPMPIGRARTEFGVAPSYEFPLRHVPPCFSSKTSKCQAQGPCPLQTPATCLFAGDRELPKGHLPITFVGGGSLAPAVAYVHAVGEHWATTPGALEWARQCRNGGLS